MKYCSVCHGELYEGAARCGSCDAELEIEPSRETLVDFVKQLDEKQACREKSPVDRQVHDEVTISPDLKKIKDAPSFFGVILICIGAVCGVILLSKTGLSTGVIVLLGSLLALSVLEAVPTLLGGFFKIVFLVLLTGLVLWIVFSFLSGVAAMSMSSLLLLIIILQLGQMGTRGKKHGE